MGLFSRKKKIEIPLPPSEDLLKFPSPSGVKVPEIEEIEPIPPPPKEPLIPAEIKEAVGVEKHSFPSLEIKEPELPPLPEPSFPHEKQFFTKKPAFIMKKPSFLRIQHYQQLLDNLNDIKNKTLELEGVNEHLEKSRFNENQDFERLKNNLKKIHDRLLHMDDIIFKK